MVSGCPAPLLGHRRGVIEMIRDGRQRAPFIVAKRREVTEGIRIGFHLIPIHRVGELLRHSLGRARQAREGFQIAHRIVEIGGLPSEGIRLRQQEPAGRIAHEGRGLRARGAERLRIGGAVAGGMVNNWGKACNHTWACSARWNRRLMVARSTPKCSAMSVNR